ncbi:MAG: Ribosomal large subunit methyltransferase, partial [Planctomycetota bacterium]
MTTFPQVILHPKKQDTFWDGHPWVLRNSIVAPPSSIQCGDAVDLVLPDGTFVARGLYHPTSRIAVRLYTWDSRQNLDDSFFSARLASAVEYRRQFLQNHHQQGCRLVFSEGDLLSGLIVDKYGDVLVLQQTASAISRFIPGWVEQ